eukprot:1190097-Prorocentrum_minimum.AAC.1
MSPIANTINRDKWLKKGSIPFKALIQIDDRTVAVKCRLRLQHQCPEGGHVAGGNGFDGAGRNVLVDLTQEGVHAPLHLVGRVRVPRLQLAQDDHLREKGIFQASGNGADSRGEYSGPRPTGRTHAGNIPGLGQRGGLMQGIFRASANATMIRRTKDSGSTMWAGETEVKGRGED